MICVSAVLAISAGVDRRVAKNPEKSFTNNLLLTRALRRVRAEHPHLVHAEAGDGVGGDDGGDSGGEGACSGSDNDLPPPQAPQPRKARWRGAFDTGTGHLMRGKGYSVPKPMRDVARASVIKFVTERQPAGWSVEDAKQATVGTREKGLLLFQRGTCNEQPVSAASYGRTKCRANHWVSIRYAPQDTVHVARVKYFLLVPHPTLAGVALRLAICDVFAPKPVVGRMMVARKAEEKWSSYAEDMNCIDGKLVTACLPNHENMYFMSFGNMTER